MLNSFQHPQTPSTPVDPDLHQDDHNRPRHAAFISASSGPHPQKNIIKSLTLTPESK